MNKKTLFIVGVVAIMCSTLFAQLLGDVNGDESITIVDALLTAQFYVGITPVVFDESVADVDASGLINIVDALLMAQYYVGIITEFPGQTETPVPTPVPTPGAYTGYWGTYVDTFGSTVDPPEGTDALVDGVASAAFVMVEEPTPEGDYPYAGMFYNPDPDGEMISITLPVTFTYRSTGNIRFTIGQEVLKDNGQAWGYDLPAVAEWTEITLEEADLSQPSWVATPTPLDLTAVYQLKWEPKMGASGGPASIDVIDLILVLE